MEGIYVSQFHSNCLPGIILTSLIKLYSEGIDQQAVLNFLNIYAVV